MIIVYMQWHWDSPLVARLDWNPATQAKSDTFLNVLEIVIAKEKKYTHVS